jgi:hypothetical protein
MKNSMIKCVLLAGMAMNMGCVPELMVDEQNEVSAGANMTCNPANMTCNPAKETANEPVIVPAPPAPVCDEQLNS